MQDTSPIADIFPASFRVDRNRFFPHGVVLIDFVGMRILILLHQQLKLPRRGARTAIFEATRPHSY